MTCHFGGSLGFGADLFQAMIPLSLELPRIVNH